jgi:predicted short-subunit dehydrogenase-like oxidoreductase (DUF2520 family)
VAFVASRTPEGAHAGAAFIGPGVEALSYAELAAKASRILIAVPDAALDAVILLLGASRGLVLHTCGTRGPEALDPLAALGAACGTIHPLQTIPDAASGVAALRGIAFAVSGHEAAVAWAGQIVHLANGRLLRIAAQHRPLYHAAAVMASNYVVALLSAAEHLLVAAGVEPAEALPALAPLARTSLDNVLRTGPARALTGPIQRGDVPTVAAHLGALQSAPAPIRRLYGAAGLQALEISKECGLPPGLASNIQSILETGLSES